MKKQRKVRVETSPEVQNYSMWNVPPDLFERFLRSLPKQEELDRLKSASGVVVTKDDESKLALEKRLKSFRTRVTAKTLKKSVG